jgi:hypothetical protein
MICEIINEVLQTGYLGVTTEQKLQLMFDYSSTLEELDALSELQSAILSGQVKRELGLYSTRGA